MHKIKETLEKKEDINHNTAIKEEKDIKEEINIDIKNEDNIVKNFRMKLKIKVKKLI